MGRRCNGGLGCAAFFAVLCALPGSVVTAQARPRADSLRAAAARLAPRTPVRLGLRTGNVLTGRLTGVDGAGLRLEGRAAAVPLDAVNHLSARGRSTGTGLKVGLIAGGIGGTIGGGLIGLVVAALCETDSCASTGTNVLIGAGLGLLAGGGGGAALGAVVGSTIPRWVEPGAAAPARIGELAATGAWSRLGSRAGGSGLGGDLSYMATFGPVAVGPDVGWHGLGTNLRQGFVRMSASRQEPVGGRPRHRHVLPGAGAGRGERLARGWGGAARSPARGSTPLRGRRSRPLRVALRLFRDFARSPGLLRGGRPALAAASVRRGRSRAGALGLEPQPVGGHRSPARLSDGRVRGHPALVAASYRSGVRLEAPLRGR